MILRPTAEDTRHVVGDCYMYGVMDGEALLGPFSEDYRVDGQYGLNEVVEGVPGYTDKNTGVQQREDPRLTRIPLPTAWEAIEWNWTRNDPASCSKHRNKQTGEIINSDPRLFPEALRDRGVPITRITLV